MSKLMGKSGKIAMVSLSLLMAVSMAAWGGGKTEAAKPAAASSGGQAGAALKAESGATIEVTYWESSTSDKAGWDLVLANFAKAHPEIIVKGQVYPSSTYVNQLDTRIAANDWPDVMRYTYQRLGKFKEAGVMLDLTGKVSDENLADLVPAYRSALTYEGKLVGMPHHTDTVAVFYNKKMFADSGIRIPKDANDGWSWEELGQIATKLKTDHKLDFAFAGIWENGSGYRYLPFVYAAGGSVLSQDMSKIAINSPETLKALQNYEGWRKANLINRTGFTSASNANMLFVAQKIAFTFSGSWHCSYMEQNMPGNWAVTYMPQINGKTGSDMGGNGLFGYKKTKYPNAVAIFIEYITSKSVVKEFCEASNFIPVRKSLIGEGLKYKNFQKEMDSFLKIVATIDPKMAADETSTRFQQLNVIWSEEMDPLVIDGSATAQQVLTKLDKRMNDALKQ